MRLSRLIRNAPYHVSFSYWSRCVTLILNHSRPIEVCQRTQITLEVLDVICQKGVEPRSFSHKRRAPISLCDWALKTSFPWLQGPLIQGFLPDD